MERRLVITADDLGVDAATNEAIVELMRDGLVSATTLIPVAPAAGDAVDRLKAAGLGAPRLHFALSSGREWEWAGWRPLGTDVVSLTDEDGTLPVSPAGVEHRVDAADVARELHAQLDWMARLGLRPTGLDSHAGTLYGFQGRSLADLAVDFCAAHDLAFRLPRKLLTVLQLTVRGLRGAHRRAVGLADERGVALPETLISAWLPGRMVLTYAQLRAEVIGQLRGLPPGTSELMVHPAPRAAATRMLPSDGRKRMWELRLLRDPVLHRELHRERISIVPAW